jgi:hypothetical protein
VKRTLAAAACSSVLFALGCGKSADDRLLEVEERPKEAVKPTVDPLADGESAVIAACLQDFGKQDDWGLRKDLRTIVLDEVTSYGSDSGCLSDRQLKADLEQRGWTIPQEIAADMRRRNVRPASLAGAKFGDPIILDDFRRLESQVEPLALEFGFAQVIRKHHPGTKAYMRLWRPGYSKDHLRCAIRFWWGWAPHSAEALYLLENRGSGWTVLNRAIIYYN